MAESQKSGAQSGLRFPKSQKLTNKKVIEELFKNGSFFVYHPLKIGFLKKTFIGSYPEVMISVPKRNFKKAVDRNKIKRRIREAYRMAKSELIADYHHQSPFPMYIVFLYTGKEIPSQEQATQKMSLIINKLKNV